MARYTKIHRTCDLLILNTQRAYAKYFPILFNFKNLFMIFKQYLNQASTDGVLPSLRLSTNVHLVEIIMVCRLNPSMSLFWPLVINQKESMFNRYTNLRIGNKPAPIIRGSQKADGIFRKNFQ